MSIFGMAFNLSQTFIFSFMCASSLRYCSPKLLSSSHSDSSSVFGCKIANRSPIFSMSYKIILQSLLETLLKILIYLFIINHRTQFALTEHE